MSKRKVATSKTTGYRNWFTGQYVQTTKTYVEEPRVGPSKTSRAMATTGLRSWNTRRAAITGAIVVWLMIAGQSPVAAWVVLGLAVVVGGVWMVRRRLAPEPEAERPTVPVGAEWCDHCADWTTHPTEQHAA